MENQSYYTKIVNKSLKILLLLTILLGQASFVLAIGKICCTDGNCAGDEKCLCDPSHDCQISDGRVTTGKAGVCGPAGSIIFCPPSTITDIKDLIEAIINWVFSIGIILAPLMIIIGAFMFLTSAGEPDKVRKAKKIIIWTIIGLAVILFSKGLISLITYILLGT